MRNNKYIIIASQAEDGLRELSRHILEAIINSVKDRRTTPAPSVAPLSEPPTSAE